MDFIPQNDRLWTSIYKNKNLAWLGYGQYERTDRRWCFAYWRYLNNSIDYRYFLRSCGLLCDAYRIVGFKPGASAASHVHATTRPIILFRLNIHLPGDPRNALCGSGWQCGVGLEKPCFITNWKHPFKCK